MHVKLPENLCGVNVNIKPLTVAYLGAVADMRGVSDVESLVFDLIRHEINKYIFNCTETQANPGSKQGVKDGK